MFSLRNTVTVGVTILLLCIAYSQAATCSLGSTSTKYSINSVLTGTLNRLPPAYNAYFNIAADADDSFTVYGSCSLRSGQSTLCSSSSRSNCLSQSFSCSTGSTSAWCCAGGVFTITVENNNYVFNLDVFVSAQITSVGMFAVSRDLIL
jgi:hypothetical protein